MPAGSLLRGLHYWSASALILIAILHLLRVLYHGAYKDLRRENWWVGLALLAIVFGFAFTGYLLPWDQRDIGPRWSVCASRERARGGTDGREAPFRRPRVGASALSRFAAVHFIFLPAAAFLLVLFHLLLLARHGHAGLPGSDSSREPFLPRQAARDATLIALVFAPFFRSPISRRRRSNPPRILPIPAMSRGRTGTSCFFFSCCTISRPRGGRRNFSDSRRRRSFSDLPAILDRSPLRLPRARRIWIGIAGAIFAGAGVLTAVAALEKPASSRLATTEPPLRRSCSSRATSGTTTSRRSPRRSRTARS